LACCLFLLSLFVLRQLVLSWGFVFRLTRVTRRNFDGQARGTGTGRACHGRKGEAISPVHNISLSRILVVLFCLFDNPRSCTRYYSLWVWIRISLASYKLIFTSHKETAHGLHTCHHGPDHIHNTAEETLYSAFGKDQPRCHCFVFPQLIYTQRLATSRTCWPDKPATEMRSE
jgi:hypothetical protein